MSLLSTTPEAIAREMERVAAFPPAPPPPWADDPEMTARVCHALRELDLAGGWVKPDPLLDPIAAPDFYTEARREGAWPEPHEPEVVG